MAMHDMGPAMLTGYRMSPAPEARVTLDDLNRIAERAYEDGYRAANDAAREDAAGTHEALEQARRLAVENGRLAEKKEVERAETNRQRMEADDAIAGLEQQVDDLQRAMAEMAAQPVPEGTERVGRESVGWQRGEAHARRMLLPIVKHALTLVQDRGARRDDLVHAADRALAALEPQDEDAVRDAG